MNRKQLKANRFGESILSEYELYQYSFKNDSKSLVDQNSKICHIEFDWSWNDYSGYGIIYFYEETFSLCTEEGINGSNMTVSSKSKRKPCNGKSNCALYNDESLGTLFSRMLKDLK